MKTLFLLSTIFTIFISLAMADEVLCLDQTTLSEVNTSEQTALASVNTTNVTVATSATPSKPIDVNAETKVYTVQLGAFKARERAFAFYWDVAKKITPVQVIAPSGTNTLYRVLHGSYPNYQEAKAVVKKLKDKKIDCFVTVDNRK